MSPRNAGRIKDPGRVANPNTDVTCHNGTDRVRANGHERVGPRTTSAVIQSQRRGMSAGLGVSCAKRVLLLGRMRHVHDPRMPADRRRAQVSLRVADSIRHLNAQMAPDDCSPNPPNHNISNPQAVEERAKLPKAESRPSPARALHASYDSWRARILAHARECDDGTRARPAGESIVFSIEGENQSHHLCDHDLPPRTHNDSSHPGSETEVAAKDSWPYGSHESGHNDPNAQLTLSLTVPNPGNGSPVTGGDGSHPNTSACMRSSRVRDSRDIDPSDQNLNRDEARHAGLCAASDRERLESRKEGTVTKHVPTGNATKPIGADLSVKCLFSKLAELGNEESGEPPHSRAIKNSGLVQNSESKRVNGTRKESEKRDIIKLILEKIRLENSIESVRSASAESLPAFTVLELATGGCLDTMAAVLEGFHHLGGTENVSQAVGRQKSRLFEDLTRARCLGDSKDWKEWTKCITHEVDYLKSGQPCPDYAPMGSNLGCGGTQGGELFLEQLEPILTLRPKIVRLEMVPSIRTVNNGEELGLVREALSAHYHVHEKVIECWRYGDASVRQRLFLVALRRDLFSQSDFSWPIPVFNDESYPIARDIAVTDDEVPQSYWREADDRIIAYASPKPIVAGRIQQIGFAGNPAKPNEIGSSKNPNSILSWDGGLSTQLTTNGGSRRPSVGWTPGAPIRRTRLTTPAETLRAASLNEASYERLAQRQFNRKSIGMSFDMWLRELVNNGVPLGTGRAIDRAVSDALLRANVPPQDRFESTVDSIPVGAMGAGSNDVDDGLTYPGDMGIALMSKRVGESDACDGVQYGVGDSGASDHLHDSAYNPCLRDAVPSNATYATAGDKSITGDLRGKMDVTILNLGHQPECPPHVDHTITTTTVPGLGESLWSLEAEFRDNGYDIFLRHGYREGDYTGMYRPPGVNNLPESFIPMVYDHEGSGGWRVPYLIRSPGTTDAQHEATLRAVLAQNAADNARGARAAAARHEYTQTQAAEIERQCHAHACVTQSITVRVPGERNIRPAFAYGGLRRFKNKNWHEFHSAMSHMGEPGQPCAICNMFKGAPRSIPKHTCGKPRETRPALRWHMDMIVFRHRSEEGCKYLILLTDESSQFYSLIPLQWKSDATHEIERWIRAMRSHPAFKDCAYQIVANIMTDNDPVWAESCGIFTEMIERVGSLLIDYGDPADHARDNARAEGANKIIEAGIQSLLYEKNLPPSWWQRAANDVMFLANRFPPYSLDAAVPVDGDMPSPIEKLFLGYISRHQVYRELDSYVACGTPALVHKPKVKGSDLEPRVRWAIAIGQRGKVTKWMCPFVKSRFKSRSFTAFTLRTGLNWSQFLGLGEIAPSAQAQMLPQDEGESKVRVIELPEVRPNVVLRPPPVREITEAREGAEVQHASGVSGNGSDLCEFFPRIKNQTRDPRNITIVDECDVIADETDNLELSESAGELVQPLADDMTQVTTPGVFVIDHKGEKVDTRPPNHPLGSEPSPGDEAEDNLYVDGCVEHNAAGLQPKACSRKRTHDTRVRTDRQSATDVGKDIVRVDTLDKDTDDVNRLSGPKVGNGKARKRAKPSPPQGAQGSSIRDEKSRNAKPNVLPESQPDFSDMMSFDIEIPFKDQGSRAEIEEGEAQLVSKYAVTTDGKTSWSRVCKLMNAHHKALPLERHSLYRIWLLTKPSRVDENVIRIEDLPATVCNGRSFLRAGVTIPYPSGPHWHQLCAETKYREMHGDRVEVEETNEDTAYITMRELRRELSRDTQALALLARAVLADQTSHDEFTSYINTVSSELIDDVGLRAYAARKIRRRPTKVMDVGESPPPKTIVEALMGDRAEEWVKSIYDEFNGLVKQGVFSHDWTRQALHDAGIRGKPIPCSTALTHKYKDGVLTRLKTRICIAGHRGNVTQGIHYHDVFSPSPVQHTEKILQAMRVNLHLCNLAWDIKQAYTWAPLPPGERIAVVYPDGFKRYDANGDELFLVLERNLYGLPSAGRGWGKHRDAFILKRFNEPGWSCCKSVHDPCLFIIDRSTGSDSASKPIPPIPVSSDGLETLPPGIERSWVLIHTDDCDAYGSSDLVLHEINDAMNKEWKTEIVDNSFILGVKRDLNISPQGMWSITLSMTAYIAEMAGAYQSHLTSQFGKRRVRTPFPEHLLLTKAHAPRDGEVERNINRGYQRLVGSQLWCVRHVAPAASYGMAQLCKLMACPTDEAWHAAIHLLKYLDQTKDRGVKFTETDDEPCAFVDASNRDDPEDGKTQYGYSVHWGGPLIVKSSKLNHVGINSTYNEYMALHHAIKQIVWVRQLLAEIGLGEYIREPTRVYADNKQANNLCSEDLVTAGNMYFRTGYHYCKEAVRDQFVSVHYCHTSLNIIDTGTKALGPIKFEEFEPPLSGHAPLPAIPL